MVKLEKQADIVIADHARKSLPVGSISWTFVEKSVKLGRLESLENHRAGPAEQVIRVVGSAQPARKGRTPFTREDDRILMEWCIRAERQGKSLKGNEIYIQLEAKVCFWTIHVRPSLKVGVESAAYISILERQMG